MVERRRSDGGAAAVEFALVTPLLVSLLVGIVDGGRLFMADQDAATASREGARYALSGNRYADCDGIRDAATRLAVRSGIGDVDITIGYDRGPGTDVFASCPVAGSALVSGHRIVVTATRTITPVLPLFDPVTVSATERRTITKRATA